MRVVARVVTRLVVPARGVVVVAGMGRVAPGPASCFPERPAGAFAVMVDRVIIVVVLALAVVPVVDFVVGRSVVVVVLVVAVVFVVG